MAFTQLNIMRLSEHPGKSLVPPSTNMNTGKFRCNFKTFYEPRSKDLCSAANTLAAEDLSFGFPTYKAGSDQETVWPTYLELPATFPLIPLPNTKFTLVKLAAVLERLQKFH